MKKFLIPCMIMFVCAGCGQRNTATSNTATVPGSIAASEDCNDAAVMKRIQDSLAPRVVLDMTEDEYKEMMADTPLQGLQSFHLDTTFNEHCVLSVTASGEWSAAYIQGFQRYLNFDKHTGNKLSIKDLLKADSLTSLFKQFYEAAAATAKASRKDVTGDEDNVKDTGYYDEAIGSSLQSMSPENLENFYITPSGITFKHEFGFGHAFWNIAPADAELNISKDELQGYIKAAGPLSFWLKK